MFMIVVGTYHIANSTDDKREKDLFPQWRRLMLRFIGVRRISGIEGILKAATKIRREAIHFLYRIRP